MYTHCSILPSMCVRVYLTFLNTTQEVVLFNCLCVCVLFCWWGEGCLVVMELEIEPSNCYILLWNPKRVSEESSEHI